MPRPLEGRSAIERVRQDPGGDEQDRTRQNKREGEIVNQDRSEYGHLMRIDVVQSQQADRRDGGNGHDPRAGRDQGGLDIIQQHVRHVVAAHQVAQGQGSSSHHTDFLR